MENKIITTGILGALTLMFSFQSYAQERKLDKPKVEYIKAHHIKKQRADIVPVRKRKVVGIKKSVDSRVIVHNLRATDRVYRKKQERFRKPLRYKK
tara:strand:- start:34957 stop:35244 length:288 start_codon:yes stop_codon:yes gene_type:complete